jgi:acyl-[acyl-carrier-protein] desaturase
VPNLVGLTPEAEEAQQYLCKLPERIRSISDRKTSRLLAKNQPKSIAFSWLFDRTVPVL